jgi:hypothetical protein
MIFKSRLVEALVLCCSLTAFSVQADLLRDFLDQFPPASARVQEAYSHVRMKVHELYRDERGGTRGVYEGEYLCEGEKVRGIVKTIQTSEASDSVGNVKAFGGSSEQFFEARRSAGSRRFTMESLGFAPMSYDRDNRDRCRPMFGVYCLFDTRVVDYLKIPEVKVLSAEKISLDGHEAVKITTSWAASPGTPMRYLLYFAPDTWAFMGWTIYGYPDDPAASHSEWRLTYEPGSNPPRLVRMDGWGDNPAFPGIRRGGVTYDVESLQFGPIPAAEFTFAALDVGEPVVTKPRETRRWLIALNVGLICGLGVLVAILVIRLRSGAKASR